MKNLIKIIIIIPLLIVDKTQAQNTTSNNIKAIATINSSCQISADDIDLGDITPKNLTDVGWSSTATAITNLNLTCNNKVSYTIAMNLGLHTPDGSGRYLLSSNSTDTAQYTLCQTNAFQVASVSCVKTWKNTSGVLYTGTGNGTNQIIPVYVFMKKGFYKPADYSDSLTTTITY